MHAIFPPCTNPALLVEISPVSVMVSHHASCAHTPTTRVLYIYGDAMAVFPQTGVLVPLCERPLPVLLSVYLVKTSTALAGNVLIVTVIV